MGIAFVLAGFAALIAAEGHAERSAQLGGAVGAMLGIPDPIKPGDSHSHSQRVLEKALAIARAHLDEDTFTIAWARGQTMTREQAIALALTETGF